MVATPGTIPALTPYQPAALPLVGTEALEIVSSLTATAAVSGSMTLQEVVGKSPSVMTVAAPSSLDMVAFFQVSSGLPMAATFANIGLLVSSLPQLVTFGGSLAVAIRTLASGTTASLSTTTDYFLAVNVATAVTVNLPGSPPTGLTYLVKDAGGNCSVTNTITITPAAGNIDGLSTYVMSAAFQSVGVTYSGSQWSLN